MLFAGEEVGLDKVAGESLGVVLERSLWSGRVTVGKVKEGSCALGLLSVGDTVLSINGVAVADPEHASIMIKASATLSLQVQRKNTRLAWCASLPPRWFDFMDELSDACLSLRLSRKACTAACTLCIIFVVLPLAMTIRDARTTTLSTQHQLHDARIALIKKARETSADLVSARQRHQSEHAQTIQTEKSLYARLQVEHAKLAQVENTLQTMGALVSAAEATTRTSLKKLHIELTEEKKRRRLV